METLEVVLAAAVGAVVVLGAFMGWVFWEWYVRPARIAVRNRRRDG